MAENEMVKLKLHYWPDELLPQHETNLPLIKRAVKASGARFDGNDEATEWGREPRGWVATIRVEHDPIHGSPSIGRLVNSLRAAFRDAVQPCSYKIEIEESFGSSQ